MVVGVEYFYRAFKSAYVLEGRQIEAETGGTPRLEFVLILPCHLLRLHALILYPCTVSAIQIITVTLCG